MLFRSCYYLDRASLSIEHLDVAHAVVFLVRPGELVLFNGAAQVILATGNSDQTDLDVTAHCLAVQIITRVRILAQRALANKPLKIFFALGIDLRRVRIRGRRKVDFGFAHVQEAKRIACGDLPRLGRRHYIVGQFADLRGKLWSRSQCGKRFDRGHVSANQGDILSRFPAEYNVGETEVN